VVARVVRAVGDLNRNVARVAIERAVALSRARSDFTIAELAVHPRPNARATTAISRAPRLELVVEATDRLALARGMQGFQVSLARALNAAAKRRGTVFVDRYATRALPRRTARPRSAR
jgi:hypothetical protein